MARKKRPFSVFSLSFLDIMSCGFGATVLVFMLIHHSTLERSDEINEQLLIEVDTLNEEIIETELYIESAEKEIRQSNETLIELKARTRQLTAELNKARDELANRDEMTLSEREDINQLMADLKALEEQSKRLEGVAIEEGFSPRVDEAALQDGDRQYLTGLKLGGERVLILLDVSASMLDAKLVNIIRTRNMPQQRKLQAAKWQRSLKAAEWILGRLPQDVSFQVLVFNDTTRYLLEDTADTWLPVNDAAIMRRARSALQNLDPHKGTSLHHAFAAISAMEELPNNVILITDGLPTVGDTAPRRRTISSRNRVRLFRRALEVMPVGIPVNTLLLPLEGDPAAPSQFWRLAMATGGSFMSPSKDWP